MKFKDYEKMTEREQIQYLCRTLGDSELFNNVRKAFLKRYSDNKFMEVVVDRYGIGEIPAIVIDIKKGPKRILLPKSFLGFPIVKRYIKKENRRTKISKQS